MTVPPFLFKWTSNKDFAETRRRDVMRPRRWTRFVEATGRLETGNSFTDLNHLKRWRLPEHDLLLVLDTSRLPNGVYPMNGNREHLRTLGLTKSYFDATAYLHESTEIDEFFVSGRIEQFFSLAEVIDNPSRHEGHLVEQIEWAQEEMVARQKKDTEQPK